jgi:hypothetical protein
MTSASRDRAADIAADHGGFMTVKEVADFFRMTPQWAYGAIRNNEFEGVVRTGTVKGIRVPRNSVYAYMARKAQQSAA